MLFFGPEKEYTAVLRSDGSMNITVGNGVGVLIFANNDVQSKHTDGRSSKQQNCRIA
jgi:hypothetical protein